MINFNNKSNIIWTETKICILGGGKSGIAAAKLGRYVGANIFISDSNNSTDTINKMRSITFDQSF